MKKFLMTVAFVAAFAVAGQANATFTWVPNSPLIMMGSTGSQVYELQSCLADMGVNPDSNKDGIFGVITKAAVMAFQADKNILVDGKIGNQTGPFYTAACAEEMEEESNTEVTIVESNGFETSTGEEADFSDFDLDDADDDTIEEGADMAELAEYVIELDNGGAALLERMDVVLTATAAAGDETDAWEVFNTIYLMVDGEVIAEIEADDEDEWEDTTVDSVAYDEARLRISGINEVFEDDEEYTITLAADIAGSIDLGGDDKMDWTVRVANTGLRFVDEAGITAYLAEEAGDDSDTATFSIEEEGQDDELDVQSSNDDIDSTTFEVEDDESSDDYTVFIFELEADEDSSDIELEHIKITVDMTGDNDGADDIAGNGDDVAATYDAIVKDVYLLIDGEEFDDVTYVDGVSTILDFDIDKDFEIDSGETVNVELVMEFASANGDNYIPGATVAAKVLAYSATTGVDGEGADDLTAGGSATGDVHTLEIEGIFAEMTSEDANVVVVDDLDNDQAEFEIIVDVEAFEIDAYISQFAATSITYSIIDASNGNVAHSEAGVGTVATGSAVVSLSSSADLDGNFYRVNENDTEEFVFTVTYTPGDGGLTVEGAGSYRLQLDSIEFEPTAVAPTETYATIPAQDFETGNVNVIS